MPEKKQQAGKKYPAAAGEKPLKKAKKTVTTGKKAAGKTGQKGV